MHTQLGLAEKAISYRDRQRDHLSAVFGNIELTRPTDAEAQIVLTEADINRAFSSDYIQGKLHNLKMKIEGCPIIVDVQQVTVNLLGGNEFVFTADFC